MELCISRVFGFREYHEPEFEIKKGLVTDEMIRERAQASSHAVPRPSPPGIPSRPDRSSQPFPSLPEPASEGRDSLEVCFLRDIEHYPESGVADRYKRVRISVRQGQRLKAKLASAGLIEEQEELTKTGRIRRIRLTEKGRLLLKKGLQP